MTIKFGGYIRMKIGMQRLSQLAQTKTLEKPEEGKSLLSTDDSRLHPIHKLVLEGEYYIEVPSQNREGSIPKRSEE